MKLDENVYMIVDCNEQDESTTEEKIDKAVTESEETEESDDKLNDSSNNSQVSITN